MKIYHERELMIIMDRNKMKSVYICGSKSIGQYGGFESFIQKLIQYHKDISNIHYYIACKANGDGSMDISQLEGASEIQNNKFLYYNAECFLIKIPEWMGSAQAIYYDIAALKTCCRHIEENKIQDPIVYVLACRIGPFFKKYVRKIHALGGRVYLNPDGHEWKRKKWSALVRKYWKISEKLMVKYSDFIICDSRNIEEYISSEYQSYHPKTTFIAYGAELQPSSLADNDERYVEWLSKYNLNDHNFYISVGRFVPENNFETMIKEFMKSHSKRDFAIITTQNKDFLEKLDRKLHFSWDQRIKFVGTVYDSELLKKIRENAFGYFHGHSVGGTNPSLLEALGSTKLNLLYNVSFNQEVAGDAALYWSLEEGSLSALIDQADELGQNQIEKYGRMAKQRIRENYTWEKIALEYKRIFTC